MQDEGKDVNERPADETINAVETGMKLILKDKEVLTLSSVTHSKHYSTSSRQSQHLVLWFSPCPGGKSPKGIFQTSKSVFF